MTQESFDKFIISASLCPKLLQISLCYCGLLPSAGKALGVYASKSVIRNLYLDGNDLQLNGILLCLFLVTYNDGIFIELRCH